MNEKMSISGLARSSLSPSSFPSGISLSSSVKFEENFWDEKLTGFEILMNNLRNSQTSVKELVQYLRDCLNGEDQYVKHLHKQSAQIQKFLTNSTWSPVWSNVLKVFNDEQASVHLNFMNQLVLKIKELQKYYKEMRQKKKLLKQNEAKTAQAIESFKSIRHQLNKSKEQYYHFCLELNKLLQKSIDMQNQSVSSQFSSSMSTSNNLAANIQKLEKKKTSSLDEYKSNVHKYNSMRDELEKRFNDSCQVFQTHEELHLKQMQVFMGDYFGLINELNDSRKRIFTEIHSKLSTKYSNDYLLQQMVISRRVGYEIPKRVEFVEYADWRDPRLTTLKSNSIPILEKSLLEEENDGTGTFHLSTTPNNTPKSKFNLVESKQQRTNENNKSSRFSIDFSLSRNRFKSSTNSKKTNNKQRGSDAQQVLNSSFSFSPSTVLSIDRTFDKQLSQLDELESAIKESKENKKQFISTSFDSSLLDNFNETKKTSQEEDELGLGDDYFATFENLNKPNRLKENTDMNNLYESSEDDFIDAEKSANLTSELFSAVDDTSKRSQVDTLTRTSEKLFSSVNSLTSSSSSSSSFSSDSEDSDVPKRIVFHIKNSQDAQNKSQECSAEFLNQISKNLKLEVTNNKKLQFNKTKRNESTRAEKVANKIEANVNVDFTNEKHKQEGASSSQISHSGHFMSSSLTSHTSSVMCPTRPDSALSNPSESYFLHSQVFEMDENNNRMRTTPTKDMQVMNKAQSTPNAPPLPPLPVNLQQKAQEQQEKFLRSKSPTLSTLPQSSPTQQTPIAQTDSDHKQTELNDDSDQKKEPIVINAQVELNNNNNKNEKRKHHSDIVTITASAKGYKNLRLNLTLPGEDRTQF